MQFRAEQAEDIEAIRQVNIAAFGRESEADLVDRLRGIPSTLSFVAVESLQVVGLIFFSPVEIEGSSAVDQTFDKTADQGIHQKFLGLAPIAVLPDFQHQGIGTMLIRHGLTECDRLGYQAIVVLGDPHFYSRFGFISAKQKRLECEFKVPDEAFMILELRNNALDQFAGIV
jgi:putative acetyltransferase